MLTEHQIHRMVEILTKKLVQCGLEHNYTLADRLARAQALVLEDGAILPTHTATDGCQHYGFLGKFNYDGVAAFTCWIDPNDKQHHDCTCDNYHHYDQQLGHGCTHILAARLWSCIQKPLPSRDIPRAPVTVGA